MAVAGATIVALAFARHWGKPGRCRSDREVTAVMRRLLAGLTRGGRAVRQPRQDRSGTPPDVVPERLPLRLLGQQATHYRVLVELSPVHSEQGKPLASQVDE